MMEKVQLLKLNNIRNLFVVIFIFFVTTIHSQVIVSVYKNVATPIQFSIDGKSKIKFKNPQNLIDKIKSDTLLSNYFNSYKDSLQYEPHSSLMLFKIDCKDVSIDKHNFVDFELDNLIGDLMLKHFKELKFKNVNHESLIGFYLFYIPDKKIFNIGFVECKKDKYYSIYETACLVE